MAGIIQNYKFGLIYMERQLGLSLIGESCLTRPAENGGMCQMKKRKFRAMTIGEYCECNRPTCRDCGYSRGLDCCDYSKFHKVQTGRELYKTKDGKYILIEVEE